MNSLDQSRLLRGCSFRVARLYCVALDDDVLHQRNLIEQIKVEQPELCQRSISGLRTLY